MAKQITKNILFRCRFSTDSVGKTYEGVLEGSIAFDNPRCFEHLSELVGLDSNTFYTNMSGLRGKYPNDEYSSELRQSQASSWAFRYVSNIQATVYKQKFPT